MKHILFVKGLNDKDDVDRLTEELEQTRLDFEISLETQSVMIKGKADDVYAAKNAIAQAGYIVK